MGVRFVLDGQPVEVADTDGAAARTTLLQWLRASGRTGVKEGCAEGECGACAVALVGADAEGRPRFEAVNSCLLLLLSVDGRTVVTPEGISPPGGPLHPVQRALVDQGGSQCGYCTPGFAVSLFCEYYRPGRAGYDPEAIAGNLCRCTGYRPIIDAAKKLASDGAPLVRASPGSASDDDPWRTFLRGRTPRPAATAGLTSRAADRTTSPAVEASPSPAAVRPTSLAAVFEALAARPGATLLAGGTDLVVYANQRGERWSSVIAVDAVPELQEFRCSAEELAIGAGVPLSRLEEHLRGPAGTRVALLEQLFPLFSSRLVRNRATLGGSLATASPIGDAAPALLALDAELTLARASGTRRLPLRDFFTGYRRTALAPGELIQSVHVRLPLPACQRFYKVSRRVLDDISTVAAAAALDLDGAGRVARFRLAYAGIAATPLRATSVERLALGQPWTREARAALLAAAEPLGTPLSDHRGSAAYRKAMITKLLERFFVEIEPLAGPSVEAPAGVAP